MMAVTWCDAFPHERARVWVVGWLGTVCAAIFLMVLIGGITRLTESGLSIVEWDLVSGTLPPLSGEQWNEAFAKYQESPQYRILYPEMTLAEFKTIFWWEYIHRLWGRFLGIWFGVPLAWFAWRGWIRGRLLGMLLVALVLGGTQGALGWFMVQSGLNEVPRISGYRLTAHLLLATGLLVYLFWITLRLGRWGGSGRTPGWIRGGLAGLVAMTFVQIGLGGFMAGTDAALVAPTFPLINQEIVPTAAFAGSSLLRDIFENPLTLQFVHRSMAYVLLALSVVWICFAWDDLKERGARFWAAAFPLAVLGQGALGAITVIQSIGSVPVFWGVAHQGLGVTTLLLGVAAWLRLSPIREGSDSVPELR
jgi:cytochrome c oxidase assembly protein subunit 15